MSTPTKQAICALLDKWIRQRPGLEFANYGDVSSYRSELRSITKDGAIAKQLLQYVEGRDSITADDMAKAFRESFSGRLSLKQRPDGAWQLDYCTGQYWPTEFRRAACAVLASIIWNYWRDAIPEEETARAEFLKARKAENAGDYLRRKAVREFGRGIGRRFFD